MEHLTKKRGDEGFTLIELLIVIVILGILAAIVVFAVGSTGKNAAASACNADAKSLETALESYKAQTGGYPITNPTSTGDTADWAPLTGNNGSNGPYLRAIPSNPTHYQVWFDTNGSVYVSGPLSTPYPNVGNATENFDTNPGLCGTVAK